MLRTRVIPIILLDGFSVLKTIRFDQRRNLGSPITVARTYNTRNVDELIILDIDASKLDRAIDEFTIQDIAEECFMPLTVGGGVRTLGDIRKLLHRGADKVAINTEALNNPEFIAQASKEFGTQCIVVSIDIIKVNGHYLPYKKGRPVADIEVLNWCKQAETLGAGELLINRVDLDGTMSGADTVLAQQIATLVNIPVIYAGGISSPENAAEVASTGIAAVAAASIYHFTSTTPNDCKLAMSDLGIPVRL